MPKILDHGALEIVNSMGDDFSIERAARVSYAGHTGVRTIAETTKLIRYLMKHKHTSPFEAVVFTFYVKAPIFVFRQWHRHRTWSFNELSARYRELSAEYYLPDPKNITVQSTDNKQMRTTEEHPQSNTIQDYIHDACSESFHVYKKLLVMGCPRELARSVLPVGTYSEMYATVSLHNLFRFLNLRLHEHAQWEIRQYAEAILVEVADFVPIAVQAYRDKLSGVL